MEQKGWNTSLGIDMTMLELEESFIILVNNIDQRIHSLVQRTMAEAISANISQPTDADFGHLREMAEMNWKWLDSLSQTVQKHTENAIQYHMFHQTLLDYQLKIPELGLAERSNGANEHLEGSYDEANAIFHELKTHIRSYLLWWQKIEILISRSRTLSPIGLRLKPTDIKRPSTMLVDYKCDNIIVHKGDKVLLTQNNTIQRWNIENTRQDQITGVPSICCELSPPDLDAIESAIRLRIKLLNNWTRTVKELGYHLMRYIAKIISDWSNTDVSECVIQGGSKNNIYKSLYAIELLLKSHCSSSTQFLYLQNRINMLRVVVEIEVGEEAIDECSIINRNTLFIDISPQVLENYTESNCKSETFILQKRSINILVNLYKEIHKCWDSYKEFTENPSLLSLIENIKNSTGSPDEIETRSSDRLMRLLTEKGINSMNDACNEIVQINIPMQSLKKPSSTDFHHSKFDNSIPAEKELCFFKTNSLPCHIKSPQRNINQYLIDSLLPKSNEVSKRWSESKLHRYDRTNKSDTLSKFSTNQLDNDRMLIKSTKPNIQSNKIWSRDVYWQSNRIQPYYLVLSLPNIDRIIAIQDQHHNKSVSPAQSIEEGLSDENFLEILDTDTNIKYHFHAALSRGLITIAPTNNTLLMKTSNGSSEDVFIKNVFKIDGIFDPNTCDWINLIEAIDRNVLSNKSGQIKLTKTTYCHILSAMNRGHVRGRKIYNCNIGSLPSDMTVEIPRFMQL